MRDPARIGPTLDALREVWEQYPDMRLGQLIVNAVGQNVWNTEEPALLEGLEALRHSRRHRQDSPVTGAGRGRKGSEGPGGTRGRRRSGRPLERNVRILG